MNTNIVIQILDCTSSFAKSNNNDLLNCLIELGFVEQILILLNIEIDSNHFYESCLRCLRSFFLSKSFSNQYVTTPMPCLLLCDRNKYETVSFVSETENALSNEESSLVNTLFENSQTLDVLHRLLSISKSTQISIVEILCCTCVSKDRQNQIVEKDFIQPVMHLLVENSVYNHKISLIRYANREIILYDKK